MQNWYDFNWKHQCFVLTPRVVVAFCNAETVFYAPSAPLAEGGELVKSDMGSAQKDGVLFKKLFPMTNNSEKKIKFEFTQGAVPKFTLNRFSYQYFSNPKTQIIWLGRSLSFIFCWWAQKRLTAVSFSSKLFHYCPHWNEDSEHFQIQALTSLQIQLFAGLQQNLFDYDKYHSKRAIDISSQAI